jgi:tRNA-2-methylthio-N6-dimethylallyladenosine synthase
MKGVYIQTYGCQMNVSDSDRMEAILAGLNYEKVAQPETADLVLINTCSIREKAENKLSSFAYELRELKESRPEMLLGVTGCVAQQEKENILKELPFVDIVLGPDNIDDLPMAIERLERGDADQFLNANFGEESRIWSTKTLIKNPGPVAFVNVMKGCDHFCSYCIVPWTRGRERSRPIEDIIRDSKELVSRGVREITFLGQNINTFGKRSGESLHELFYRAHDIEGLERIRFTTSHPGDIKDELIECFKDLPKLCSNFHLPVQSGSNKILRGMRRFYTVEEYLEKVAKLLEARPDMSFSTDIIVGFPGETEEDFLATYDLLEKVRYDNVYSFVFSPRPGTPAALRSEGQIPEIEKLARLSKLQLRARTISEEQHKKEVGKVKEILIEGPSKKNPAKYTGRTSQNVPVHVDFDPNITIPGKLIHVDIFEGSITNLRGRPSEKSSQKISPIPSGLSSTSSFLGQQI